MAVTTGTATDDRVERITARAVAVQQRAGGATWWYDWVNAHRVGGIALVGVIATQLGTYFGYVFPAIGLPQLPWPAFNGVLAAPGEAFDSAGAFFTGQMLHFVNGIVFAILYAVLALKLLPGRNTPGGNVLKGLTYGVIMTIISVGVLVPYAYVPKQGFGLFTFYGPAGWKLPFAVLLWHLIYGLFLGLLFQVKDDEETEAA
jgi:hypothetical protein